ncbi:MAG: hypothetical protein AB8B69_16860 [Chitinophagales bacterium]
MSQTSDLELLELNPNLLIEKYHAIIYKVVSIYTENSPFNQLSHAELLKGVNARLPQYLPFLYQKQLKKSLVKTLLLEACRILCNQVEDLHLLEADTNQLILKYKPTIYARVYTYVNTDYLRSDQVEDMAHYVLERLLKKLKSENFGYIEIKSLFRTYFFQTINNAIKDGLRQLRSKKASIGMREVLKDTDAIDKNIFNRLTGRLDLEIQCKLYDRLLQLYKTTDRTKFELSAKVSYYILLENKDVQRLELNENMKVELLVCFGERYTDMSKEDVWSTLVIFTNLIERKNISGDGMQKWFFRRRNWMVVKILYIMNFNGRVQKKLNETEKKILLKIRSRSVGKVAEDYFGEIVYGYYKPSFNTRP